MYITIKLLGVHMTGLKFKLSLIAEYHNIYY